MPVWRAYHPHPFDGAGTVVTLDEAELKSRLKRIF